MQRLVFAITLLIFSATSYVLKSTRANTCELFARAYDLKGGIAY
jgi:hypothetical protein